jgi:hypothetical protein
MIDKVQMVKKVGISKEKIDKMAPLIEKKEAALARLKQDLGEEYACFVLITCTQPDLAGKMEVALDFEGDETLASFLIENAAQMAEDRDLSTQSE